MKTRNRAMAIALAAACVSGVAGAVPAQAAESSTRYAVFNNTEDECVYNLRLAYQEKVRAGYQISNYRPCGFSRGNWNGEFYYG